MDPKRFDQGQTLIDRQPVLIMGGDNGPAIVHSELKLAGRKFHSQLERATLTQVRRGLFQQGPQRRIAAQTAQTAHRQRIARQVARKPGQQSGNQRIGRPKVQCAKIFLNLRLTDRHILRRTGDQGAKSFSAKVPLTQPKQGTGPDNMQCDWAGICLCPVTAQRQYLVEPAQIEQQCGQFQPRAGDVGVAVQGPGQNRHRLGITPQVMQAFGADDQGHGMIRGPPQDHVGFLQGRRIILHSRQLCRQTQPGWGKIRELLNQRQQRMAGGQRVAKGRK